MPSFDALKTLRNVFALQKNAPLFIEHTTGRQQSYSQALSASWAITRKLEMHGISASDRVCIIADNSLEVANLFLALWHCGACIVPLNPQLSKQHLAEILRSVDAKYIIVGFNHLELAKTAIDGSGSNVELIAISNIENPATKACCDTIDLTAMVGDFSETPGLVFEHLDQDAVCMIIFTSGSTAEPKGVQIALRNLMHNEQLFCDSLEIDSNNRFLHMFPMSYLAGTHNLLLLPMCKGASIVLLPALGGSFLFEFWNIVRQHQINTLWFTSTMLAMILQVDDGAEMDWLGKQILRGIVGMAPLPAATKQKFEERFGFFLHENFALSETAFISSSLPNHSNTLGSKGFILDGVSVHIRDVNERTKTIPPNEEGELLVQSPFLMKGYFNATKDDNNNLTDEGFFTGDIGYVKDNELYITGRKKDLIIRGGINISPTLVEAVITTIDGIAEVCVVGVPHSIYGEEVAAVLVLSSKANKDSFSRNALAKLLEGKLAYFQQPKTIKILDSLPAGLTGKIDKKTIAKLFT